MDKVKAIFNLFNKGSIVSDPVAWKTGQITVGVLTSLLASVILLLKVFGYELPISPEQETAIATVVIFLVGLFQPVATVVSSEKVGLQPKGGDTNSTPTDPFDKILG